MDECKKKVPSEEEEDEEETCVWEISDTERVTSLIESEMTQLIRDAPNKVLKAVDKTTKSKKKDI